MKIFAYRTTMPFNNRDKYNNPSISPSTERSVMPFNNVPTIQDVMNKNVNIEDVYPHTRGNWAPGKDLSKSYKPEGNEYKRKERDFNILLNMFPSRAPEQKEKWKIKTDGGSLTFMSLPLARKYLRENNIPLKYLSRIAQNVNSENTVNLVADSIKKCFMVESINLQQGVREIGSAFCVGKNTFATCAHVIKKYNKNKAQNIAEWVGQIGPMVNLIQEGKKTRARVIAVDTKLDLALLKADIDVEPFNLAIDARVGEDIVAIGSPHGYENNVSAGVISSDGRKIYYYQGAPEYMFFDATVMSGSSGGPIIRESDGAVIGIITLIISAGQEYGLNAALDASYLIDFIKKQSLQ